MQALLLPALFVARVIFACSIFIAFNLFCPCERSFWHCETRPVGRWVMRTAESVLLTCCPPARLHGMCQCGIAGSMVISMSGASGIICTAAKEVCLRLLVSNGEMRTSL